MTDVIITAVWVMGIAAWLYGMHHMHRFRQTYWKRDAERWRHLRRALSGGVAMAVVVLVGFAAATFALVAEGRGR